MRNFQRLATGLNMTALGHELARQESLWNQNRLRTTHPGSPHGQVDDIWLRFQDVTQDLEAIAESERRMREDGANVQEAIEGMEFKALNTHECINYPALAVLPSARQFIFDLMAGVKGERLGRCLITRMRPGATIAPHVDSGEHSTYYDRYHIAIQVLPGVVFRCGDEAPAMSTGEIWWFQNAIEHEVINNSADDRLTLIIDIHHSPIP